MRIYNRIMEVFWLAATVCVIAWAVYFISEVGFSNLETFEQVLCIVMPIIAFLLWSMRRNFRKRMQQHQEQNPD